MEQWSQNDGDRAALAWRLRERRPPGGWIDAVKAGRRARTAGVDPTRHRWQKKR